MATTTAERIEVLESALAEGVLTVRYGDQSITYQSVDQLKSALAYFRDKAAREAGRRPVVSSVGAFYRS